MADRFKHFFFQGQGVQRDPFRRGDRVVRGPSWKWGDQDGGLGGLGTVVTEIDCNGWQWVKWDRTGEEHAYRVLVTSVLAPKPADMPEPRFKAGDRVVRGPEWKWLDQDGGPGGDGIITEVRKEWLNVHWNRTNRRINYRVRKGQMDLIPAPKPEAVAEGPTVSAAYLKAGDRVVRGPDWESADQDGGPGGRGTIVAVCPHDSKCVRVKWDGTGEEHSYRMGKDGKLDLLLVCEVMPDAMKIECEVCMEDFDGAQRRPKVLPCGHTLCLRCVTRSGRCEKRCQAVIDDVNDLPDNFYIIALIENAKSCEVTSPRKFYCQTCQSVATPVCEEEHDICSLKKIRQTEIVPQMDAVKAGMDLQKRVVDRLVTLLPVVAENFNRLVNAATERQDDLQYALERVEGVLQTAGSQASWVGAAQSLAESALQCADQRPGLERMLAVLERGGRCHLELELAADQGDDEDDDDGLEGAVGGAGEPSGQRGTEGYRAVATADLSVDSEVTRALRFVLYLLASSGNLQTARDNGDGEWKIELVDGEEAGGGGDFEEEDPQDQGAVCPDLLSQRTRRCSRGGAGGGSKRPRQPSRPSPASRENYELLKTLETQAAVGAMQDFDCRICLETFGPGDGIILKDCLHVFCRECLKNHVQHSEEAAVRCPYQDDDYACESVLSEREIRTLVPPEVFEQHLQRSIKQAESAMDNTFHCKTVDCTGFCQFEPGVNQFFCFVCNHSNCLQCQVIHETENCKQYQERIKRAAETDAEARATHEAMEAMLREGTAMRCPKCSVVIMKRGGCDGMVCAMCKLNICWATKQARWGPGGKGDRSGGCHCGENGRRCHPQCGNCH